MSNSPLVSYTKISPYKGNWNGYRYVPERNQKIEYIIIHCVVGQCSVETLGDIFSRAGKDASSNYGVGYDGRIGMYVEEKDRSWCTSSSWADNRGVTIEVACDTFHPYAVNSKAWKGMIDLIVDICKRNNIKELRWKADKNLIGNPAQQNMLVHRWFDNKACPGEYLYSRHGQIAKEVNERLKGEVKPTGLEITGVFEYESTVALQKWLGVPFVPDGEISGQIRDLYIEHFPSITTCTFEETGSQTIKLLQKYLNGKGFKCGEEDGLLGEKTVKAWQSWLNKQGNKLDVDGIFGPLSVKAMQKFLNNYLLNK